MTRNEMRRAPEWRVQLEVFERRLRLDGQSHADDMHVATTSQRQVGDNCAMIASSGSASAVVIRAFFRAEPLVTTANINNKVRRSVTVGKSR